MAGRGWGRGVGGRGEGGERGCTVEGQGEGDSDGVGGLRSQRWLVPAFP